MNWIKVVSFNMFLTLSLIGMLLLAPPIIYLGYQIVSSKVETMGETQSSLHIYNNFDWAEQHFKELSELTISYYDYITWRRDDYSGQTVNITNGIRTTYSDSDTSTSAQEFWFFGGSTTWGTGVTNELTYPSMFARNNSVKAVNFGETGYIARQSLSYLQNIFIKNETASFNGTKTIVFYDGINDIGHQCRSHINGLGTGSETQIRDILERNTQTKYSFARTFSQLSDLLVSLTRKLGFKGKFSFDSQAIYNCASDPSRAEEVAKNLVETWISAHNLSKTHAVDFFAVLQPVAFIGDASYDYLRMNSQDDLVFAEQFKAVYPLVRQLAVEANINFIDLTSVYDGCADCYIDAIHVGPQAHSLLTNALSLNILGVDGLIE